MFRTYERSQMKRSKGNIIPVLVAIALINLLAVDIPCNVIITLVNEATAFSSTEKGSSLLSAVNSNGQGRYNVTLWVRDYENKTSLGNLNVTIFDLAGGGQSSQMSNATGHINLWFLNAGSYGIAIQTENRTVGFQTIYVSQNATHLIRTWAYNFNMTLVDSQGNPLANHTVLLYDQMSFETPQYTVASGTVSRRQNITVNTENPSRLVRQAIADENGTLSLWSVWNGTYRMKVVGVETTIEEYILGELVVTHLPPAVGEQVTSIQETTNATVTCRRADLELLFVSASNSTITMKNAEVFTRDRQGNLMYHDYTNETGFVEHRDVYVFDGTYVVTARYGNRTIGYKIIEVTKPQLFTIKCWTNNLTVTCIDTDGGPLAEYIVLLYDQVIFYSPTNVTVVTNQTMTMVNWTRTDEQGVARFDELWNGTYWITVTDGGIIKEQIVDLQETKAVTIIGDKTFMALTFTTMTGMPLSGATVVVFDADGNLIFRERTDANGRVLREGLRQGSYTINVLWMGTQVWSGSVDIRKDRDKLIRCRVYLLTVRCLDQLGSDLPKASVIITGLGVSTALQADDSGMVSLLLPQGQYRILVSYDISENQQVVNLNDDVAISMISNVKPIIWLSAIAVILPVATLTVFLERRKLRTPLKIRKYKTMLFKLESMYKNGVVEYKIYRKLREEYESKIMELGGREMR
jgi:hypothetical protein